MVGVVDAEFILDEFIHLLLVRYNVHVYGDGVRNCRQEMGGVRHDQGELRCLAQLSVTGSFIMRPSVLLVGFTIPKMEKNCMRRRSKCVWVRTSARNYTKRYGKWQ